MAEKELTVTLHCELAWWLPGAVKAIGIFALLSGKVPEQTLEWLVLKGTKVAATPVGF